MKIAKIVKSEKLKLVDGTLPDIDSDFPSKDRGKVKRYIEERFGQSQVCSVGSFTTMKGKGLIKDLARTADVDFQEVNLMNAILENSDTSGRTKLGMVDIYGRAAADTRVKAFIKDNSDLFNMMPSLFNQPKTKSIHPCAMIIFPDVMSSGEWVPTRFQQGQVVSEWSGGEMDDAGFLKEDILAIKQLDKFQEILRLIKKNGKQAPDIYDLPHDDEVYRYFTNGWNGDVFQFSSPGLVGYTRALKPTCINDLTVAVAVYRPGPMSSGYHESYVKCKNEGKKPEYLWGTEEITKDTYGLLIYQEQIMEMCRNIGDLTMKEADDVRRAMGKLKLKALLGWSEKIKKGFMSKGATEEQFQEVWDATVEFAKYCFNKSHSVAYAMTGYISQYLKVNFPIEYWTIALDYADEKKTLEYLSEIFQAKQISISSPDINSSGISMSSNQETSTIFWGIESIKGIGEDTAMQIIDERVKNGSYNSFADFFFRHNFKGSKVKKQTFEALVTCGAFDKLYKFKGCEQRRMLLINRYRKFKKVKISNPKRDLFINGKTSEQYWWKLQEKNLTGLAFIDYEEIAEETEIDTQFCSAIELSRPQTRAIYRAFGGYIVECKVARSKNGQYARLLIENNYKLFRVMIWAEQYQEFKEQLTGAEKSLIVFDAELKYDPKFSKANQFTLKDTSRLKVM